MPGQIRPQHRCAIDQTEYHRIFQKSQKCLWRPMVDGGRNTHKIIACEVCNSQITGTDPVYYLDKDQILKHKNRLSVQSYNEYFGDEFDPVLAKQCGIDGLPGILLSPRSTRNKEGKFVACSHRDSSLSNGFLKSLRIRCQMATRPTWERLGETNR